MSTNPAGRRFLPGDPDAAGIVTWVHVGDLHMTRAGEQNHRDLLSIVQEINEVFAGSIAFVYLPGDVADDGSAAAYAVVRDALDRLQAPWCSILGDHDVHEKSFANYLAAMMPEKHYAFAVGPVLFIALNAYDIPEPPSFAMLPEQLDWLQHSLARAQQEGRKVVLLLHCYPSDLKQGGDRLSELVRDPVVRLVDMGHTHYNELANDGTTLYSATRSTGQIEEGPVGFSITNMDGDVISWKFVESGDLPVVMITSPADERLLTGQMIANPAPGQPIVLRAKAWGKVPVRRVSSICGGKTIDLSPIPGSRVWQGTIAMDATREQVQALRVVAEDEAGNHAEDAIRWRFADSAREPAKRALRDQDNVVEPWPERGLLGTQLGPNKNGRKW